jgi:hypothetical protein
LEEDNQAQAENFMISQGTRDAAQLKSSSFADGPHQRAVLRLWMKNGDVPLHG